MENIGQSTTLTPKIPIKKTYLHYSQNNTKKHTINIYSKQFTQRINQNQGSYQNNNFKIRKSQRQYPPFFQKYHPKHIADQKAIKQAQNQLQQQHKYDLSGYLRKKFKQYVGKRHQFDNHERILTSALSHSSSEDQKSITSIRQLLTIQKYSPNKYQKGKIINEAFLLNAKQKIDRMITLKRQRQDYYKDIKDKLKNRMLQKVKHRHKTDFNQKKSKQLQLGLHNQEWDKQWINNYINQKMRYKKRVINKKINSQFHYPVLNFHENLSTIL